MPTPAAPPDAAVARFRADLEALTGPRPGKLAIAVSGGADSFAALILAHAAYPGDVVASTIDHGLRVEAVGEASYVREVCEQLGVEHHTGRVLVGRGNMQAQGRVQRYAHLLGWVDEVGANWLITGHHADDQLETLIMRLNRASGVKGLAGIRPRDGIVVRPFLGWVRAELEAIVVHCGVPPISDPSNEDDRFDRARLRKTLRAVDWLDRKAVARSTAALADAEEALAWQSALAFKNIAAVGGGRVAIPLPDFHEYPREIRRRLVLLAIRAHEPGAEVREKTLDQLLEVIGRGGKTMAGDTLVAVLDQYLTFSPAPPRRATRPAGA